LRNNLIKGAVKAFKQIIMNLTGTERALKQIELGKRLLREFELTEA